MFVIVVVFFQFHFRLAEDWAHSRLLSSLFLFLFVFLFYYYHHNMETSTEMEEQHPLPNKEKEKEKEKENETGKEKEIPLPKVLGLEGCIEEKEIKKEVNVVVLGSAGVGKTSLSNYLYNLGDRKSSLFLQGGIGFRFVFIIFLFVFFLVFVFLFCFVLFCFVLFFGFFFFF